LFSRQHLLAPLTRLNKSTGFTASHSSAGTGSGVSGKYVVKSIVAVGVMVTAGVLVGVGVMVDVGVMVGIGVLVAVGVIIGEDSVRWGIVLGV